MKNRFNILHTQRGKDITLESNVTRETARELLGHYKKAFNGIGRVHVKQVRNHGVA